MAYSIGQKIISPAIIGGIGAGGYSLNNKMNGDYSADPYAAARTGAIVGAGVGMVSVSNTVVKGVSKKVSSFTNPTGASPESLRLYNQF